MARRDMQSGQAVWHAAYNGPRPVNFVELFRKTAFGDKAVVAVAKCPEVVDAVDLFESRAACFRECARRAQRKAMQATEEATKWLNEADAAEAKEVIKTPADAPSAGLDDQ